MDKKPQWRKRNCKAKWFSRAENKISEVISLQYLKNKLEMAEESISEPQQIGRNDPIWRTERENKWKKFFKKQNLGTFVVVQPLRINLPVPGTHVWSLLQEDSTSCGATKLNYGSPRAHALQQEKSPQGEACAPQLESSPLTTTQESLCTAAKTQCSQKKKKIAESGSSLLA